MKPAKVVKYSAIILILIIMLLAAFAAAFVYLFPKETLKSIIVQTLGDSLNRPVTIGAIDYSIRGIQITDLYIYDTDKEKPYIAHSKDAAIRFQLVPLLQKQFIINYISLNDAIIHILYYTENKITASNLEKLLKELLSKEKSTITTQIKLISLNNTTVILENPPQKLKPLEGKYSIDTHVELHDDILELKNLSINLPQNRGKISGDCSITITSNYKIQGDFTLRDCDLLWVYNWGKNLANILPYRVFSGTIDNLLITKGAVQGTVTGSCKLSNNAMLFLSNAFTNVNLNKKTVTVANAKGKIENSTFVLNQLLFAFSGKIQNIKVSDASINTKEIAPLLGKIDISDIAGELKGNFEYKDNSIDADVTLSNLSIGQKGTILSLQETNLLIKNNQFKKDGIQATVYSVPCVLSVATVDSSFEKFTVNIEADEIDLNKIISRQPQKPEQPEKTEKEIHIPYELSGKCIIQKLYKDNLVIEKINCNYTMSKNIIALPTFSAKVFGGDITGRSVITLSSENPQITLVAKFSNARLQNISSYFQEYENRLFGNISGQLQVTIVPKDPVIDRITGKVEVSVENGKLANTGLQNGLSIWLSDLKYKLSNLEFQKIYGNFNLSGPAITINSFIFNAPDIRLKLNGQYNRHEESDVAISLEFSSNFIQDLPNPALLQLAKYKKGRWYIIPFRAQGKDIFEGKNIKQVQ
ncbi:MAG TPA: AsmA-like C-terminal region-containing protein [Spirochaetota bacterium]|nr:AsmA-like C-terminal region-containing protein [Spirochaetota bacterium]